MDLMSWPSIEFWRTSGIIVTAIGQTAFVALYITWPWWTRFLGRALFFKALAFALLVDIAVCGRIWDWAHEDATFVVLYWLLGLGVWVQFFAFLKIKLQHRDVSGNHAGRQYE